MHQQITQPFCEDIKKKITTVSLVIPEDPEHKLISIDVKCSSPIIHAVRQSDIIHGTPLITIFDVNTTTIATYIVSWEKLPPAGYFEEVIKFVIKQDGLDARTFKVSLRGEAISRSI